MNSDIIISNSAPYSDPALLLMLQTILESSQQSIQGDRILPNNLPQQQQPSLEQFIQQVNLLSILQQMASQNPQPPSTNQNCIEEEVFNEVPFDQNTLLEQQNTFQGQLNSFSLNKQFNAKRGAHFYNSLKQLSIPLQESGDQCQKLSQNEHIIPLIPTVVLSQSPQEMQISINQQTQQQSQDMQLLHFLHSCLSFDQIAQAVAGFTQVDKNQNQIEGEDICNLAKFSHLMATPANSTQYKKESSSSTSYLPFNSKSNKEGLSFLQGLSTNLNNYFDMSSEDKMKNSPSPSAQRYSSGFVPPLITPNIQLGGYENIDPSLFSLQSLFENGYSGQDLHRLREQKRLERQFKIERYKNKRRNWIRKISYDCRKRVADSRLRIKGRFISKKDSEKIKQIDEYSYQNESTENKNINESDKSNNNNDYNQDLLGQRVTLTERRNKDEGSSMKYSYEIRSLKTFQKTNNLCLAAMAQVKKRITQKKPLFTLTMSSRLPELSSAASSQNHLGDEKKGSVRMPQNSELASTLA